MTVCLHTHVRAEDGNLICKACSTKVGPKANKYGAVRSGRYASKKEADYGARLHALARDGKIGDLEEQVRFTLVPKDEWGPAIVYVADFTFIEGGKLKVMDAKGFRTKEYRIKKRLMQWVHGITVEEV